MRRADRLFQIVQHLRARRLTTAAQLADWLRVSERTVYRDVRDLSLSGVPIRGEAGVGYELDRSYELRPIMFTTEEIDAAVFGLRMVQTVGGPELTDQARSALAKIALALPQERRAEIEKTKLFAPPFRKGGDGALHNISPLRHAITKRLKVGCSYVNDANEASERTLRPLGLYFWGNVWTLTAWCDMRKTFRNFRLDRMANLEVLSETFPDEPDKSLARFLETVTRRSP